MDRILIDECLSPGLVGVAKARGHDATHVVWLGAQGIQDWNLVALIGRDDFVFVTNNRGDFLRLFAELDR
jgi:predicted nuclease of predicted toxin-antitoxin system